MPLTSVEMIEHLAGNVVTVCPIWKIISRDGLVAAYAAHTRSTVGRAGFNPASLFTFNGVTYRPSNVEPTRFSQKIGLQANTAQINGVFDDIITRADMEGGRWRMAKIVFEYVNYLDLSMGSTGRVVGIVGNVDIADPTYQLEMLSNASQLQQKIGDLTSPIDRSAFPIGADKSDWITTRNVIASPDRRHLEVDGSAEPNNYFKYGTVVWNNGFNMHSPGMDIKSSTGNVIELQLPMPDDISFEFINGVFKAVLNRIATTDEHTVWESDLHTAFLIDQDAVVSAAAPLIDGLFASDEYTARRRTDTSFTIDCYGSYLNRFPDTAGLEFWLDSLASSDRASVRASFAGASEFRDRFIVDPSLAGSADSVTLTAGYDGTRGQLHDRFDDVINMRAEPDLPGLRTQFSYPE